MSYLHIIGYGLKLGHSILILFSWAFSLMDSKICILGDLAKIWLKIWGNISGNSSKVHQQYYHYVGSKKVRRIWWKKLLWAWVVFWVVISHLVFSYMYSLSREKRKETLTSMCDERARMLQDQFNVSMNHVQALSILIATFHHGKDPTVIDQRTFAKYTDRTAFERPLTSGVAYAVRVLHSDREQFEKQQGWTIKKMQSPEQSPVHKNEHTPEALESSPIQDEYAPVIFAQDTISHVVSVDVLSGNEDRENVLRARSSAKGVLTAPFRLLKTNRLGVILTFAVYKTELSPNATPAERIQATDGYLGGVFDIESLVEKLLQQLASKHTILVNVFDTTNFSDPISMYGSDTLGDGLHVSSLNFGDPFRKHEMRCRFKHEAPWPVLAIMTSSGILVIALLVGYIFYVTMNRIARVEDDYHEMMELKKRAEAADVAKSQFLATVSHEIRTPMNGVLGMLDMLMDTELDVTQQDYVRTAQGSGKALVSLINEVLDQAKIESGKLELEAVQFDLHEILDDVISLFSGKSQEKGLELAVYISDKVPEILIGDPGRFRQIITNLMGNSIKFTEKGHIFVTVHLLEEVIKSPEHDATSSPQNTLSGFPIANKQQSWSGFKFPAHDYLSPFSLSSDVHVIVSVEDTGTGIPLEAQPRIFTPFMQVGPSISRTHGGTGIGLSISKCLVNLMKGEIGFSSLPRIGSTFTFTAVFTSTKTELKSRIINKQNNIISSEFRGMRALLVDPIPVRAEVAKYHMRRLGIKVDLASDLSQCFSILGNSNLIPQMILIEQEVWDNYSALFITNFTKFDRGLFSKLFLLSNTINTPKTSSVKDIGSFSPNIITKPLRASMLAASLQRGMGGGNKGNTKNGETPSLSLRNLLLGRKILVVDDNKVNLRVAVGALKKYGADVVCADSGKNAISLLKPPHKFDACFMDIQMPEMDGFEATRRIRDMEHNINNCIKHGELSVKAYDDVAHWHVPILTMTADVIQATHELCLKSGMDGYVSKPFEAEQLYSEVSRFFHTGESD